MKPIKNLTIYSDKIISPKKLLVLSDLHRTKDKRYSSGLKNLQSIGKSLIATSDYVIIPGDIVNLASDLENQSFKAQLIEELKSLTQGKKTLVSYGNHDLFGLDEQGNFASYNKERFQDFINEIPNFILLESAQVYSSDGLCFTSFNPSTEYYLSSGEDPEIYVSEISATTLSESFALTNFNVLLTHEPQSIIKKSQEKGTCLVPHTNLVISGHMHNGMLPNFLQRESSNQGLIAPTKEIFPKYTYGFKKQDGTTYVINGPVNTRVEWQAINDLYPPCATIINLDKPKQMIKKLK